MIKKISKYIGIFLVLFVAIILLKTVFFPFTEVKEYKENIIAMPVGFEKNISRFIDGIKISTVSYPDVKDINYNYFNEFQNFLKKAYPIVYQNAEFSKVNEHILVFKWQGINPDLKPIMFNSHYDVVPAGDDGESNNMQIPFDISTDDTYQPSENPLKWGYPAFSGAVHKGRIYGRGTLDMKNMLFSLMDSVEKLMQKGFKPERDIYLVFTPDEEVGSINGAIKLAEDFKQKGIAFDAVYDEGGVVALVTVNNKNYGVAFIGVAEKGFLTLRINVKGAGGHSSMPPLKGSMGGAGIILSRLEQNQIDANMLLQTKNMLQSFGGILDYKAKILIANQWLFKGILVDQLAKIPVANAMLRTTTALTQAKGSDAENILPPITQIVVNFRLLPGDKSEQIIKHVEKLCEGYDVTIDILTRREATDLSPEDTQGFKAIKKAINHVYPTANIAPYVTIGGTDSRNYQSLSDNVYRFMPVALTTTEQRSIHNYDESITINNYIRMVEYFTYLMENYDKE